MLYNYIANVLDVHDGDTVTLAVDLGFGIVRKDKFRLYGPDPLGKMGLNAPELGTPEGKVAWKWLNDALKNYSEVQVITVKDRQEKFGRYLAVLFLMSPTGPVNVNQALVDAGHAVLKAY